MKLFFFISVPKLYDDLCERLIYAAATLYNIKLKSEPTGHHTVMTILQSVMKAVMFQNLPGGFDKYVQQSVRRFSISWKDLATYLTPFIEGHKVNHSPTRKCPENCTFSVQLGLI